MRKSLATKVVCKLVICLILSISIFLALCLNTELELIVGVVIFLLDTLYAIYVLYGCIIRPLNELVDVVKPIDFNLNTIDFTKLDNYSYNTRDEIGILSNKFKELSDVLVARVDRVNIETYKSEHDGLSGLYNRVKYQRSKLSYSSCDNICVIYIDVNNLKKMNDEFGHEAGDALIRKAASKLEYFDGLGDCYRMGGDEFMVVMTNRSKSDCEKIINDWYPTVGCLNRKSDGFKCMMAYGVSYGESHFDMDELIKEADEKMYYHKIEIKKANGEDPTVR